MTPYTRLLLALLATLAALPAHAQEIISLAGPWDFATGRSEPAAYSDYVMLPGSMLTNGKGDPVTVDTQWTGSLYDSSFYFNPYMAKYRQTATPPGAATLAGPKFPFFLTPGRHYVGPAWYHRRVYIPKNWNDRRVTLYLERPHIETRVWVNHQEAGQQASLSTPHRYDVTPYLRPGTTNDIVIRVYNGTENVGVGQDSHSVTDQTQGNWNGIVGRIELQARWRKLSIDRVRLIPDADSRKLTVELTLDKHVPLIGSDQYFAVGTVRPLVGNQPGKVVSQCCKDILGKHLTLQFDLGANARLWDEFHPNLYQLTLLVGDDELTTNFGLRTISTRGRQLYINGRELLLRGTVESCCFPETGYPPTDVDAWKRVLAKCKEWGLNHVRFHSYCPPEAAFTAADALGVYLQPEGPSWPNHGVALGRGMPIDRYLLEESKRIVDEYGHHPSFVMMAAGNEPAGDWVNYCNRWVSQMRDYDSTKIYAGASVGGGWAWDSGSDYHVKGGARGLDPWNSRPPQSCDDYAAMMDFPRNYRDSLPNRQPIIAHEQGQWCAFPDLSETGQYTGAYKARNLEVFTDLLNAGGMADMGGKFLMASGRLQTLCYKYEIERHLRTPGYAGFQLLGLNDYSGQGTATVGPLNVHWREKGYCDAAQWRQFCSVLVPLARFPRFVFAAGDTLRVPVEAYNAFSTPVGGFATTYTITDDSARTVASGKLNAATTLPVGKNTPLGTVVMPLAAISSPAKLTLTVSFSAKWKNHWDFWVYPDGNTPTSPCDSAHLGNDKPRSSDLMLTADCQQALAALAEGRTVLLEAAGKVTLGSDVKQTYLPVFWNTSWFKMRPPHTTGAYIDSRHPLFRHGFPTDDWANLNWWELLNHAQVMNLCELPADYQPPVQPIDTWHVSRKLGMIIEARVGRGRLLMTTIDISSRLDSRLVARQLRRALMSYLASDDFNPRLTLTPDVVSHFFTRQAPPVNMFTSESPDELKPAIR